MLGQTSERHRLALRSIFRCNRGFLPAGQEQAFIEADFGESADTFMSFFLFSSDPHRISPVGLRSLVPRLKCRQMA